MSNFKAKRTYKQQQTTKFMITCAVIVLILFFYVGSLAGLYYMITKHTDDFIFDYAVKASAAAPRAATTTTYPAWYDQWPTCLR